MNEQKLDEQLILLFYGADALQDYRKEKTLPVTVYQAVQLYKDSLREARLDEVSLAIEVAKNHMTDHSPSSIINTLATRRDELANRKED